MGNATTFLIKFNIDPPNVAQAMDAINASLKNVGVTTQQSIVNTNAVGQAHDNTTKKVELSHRTFHTLGEVMRNATMMQLDFSGGSQALASNLGLLGYGLDSIVNRSEEAGVSLGTTLKNSIMGPGGIMLGLMLLVTALQYLPELLGKTSKAAQDAADQGLKAYADRFKSLAPEDQIQLMDRVSSTYAKMNAQLMAYSFKSIPLPIGWTQADMDKLERTVELLGDFKDKNKEAYESAKALREVNKLSVDSIGQTPMEKLQEQKLNIAAQLDGYEKSKAIILNERDLKIQTWKEENEQGKLSDKQYWTDRWYAEKEADNKLKQLQADRVFESKKSADELKIKDVERAKELISIEYNTQEKIKLAHATTDDERQKIEAEFAKKRIQLERDSTVLILEFNRSIITAQMQAVKDPDKLKELRAQIAAINKDIQAAKDSSKEKTTGVDADVTGKDAQRKREIEAENAQYLKQKAIDQARIREREKTNDTLIDITKELGAAQKKQAADEILYLNETDKKKRETAKNQLDIDKQSVDALEAKRIAIIETTKQSIESGIMEYDSSKSLAEQEATVIRNAIKGLIAKAIASYIGSIIASTGPLALVLAPAAGLAIGALLDSIIPKFAGGGSVTGDPGIDKVPALLTNGEFIIRKEVAEPNRKFLEAMNAGQIDVMHRASGGSVGGSVITSGSSGMIDLKKEFIAMRKQLKKLVPQVNIYSDTDFNKYDKADKKLQRNRAALAL
jgi:hypothetical protein